MPRILVVEDDRDIAELIRHYLVKAGHRVDVLASRRRRPTSSSSI
jgi:DNA-binding response OmpR family regulator